MNKTELLKDKSMRNQVQYIAPLSAKDAQSLHDAFIGEDEDGMREILGKYATESCVTNLGDCYLDYVQDLTARVLERDANKLTPEGQREAERGQFAPKTPPPKMKSYRPTTEKKITQKQKTGKSYTRTKPTGYNRAQENYIQYHQKDSLKDFYKGYNDNFPDSTRSPSSLKAKRYRLKGRRKKR